MAKIAVLHTSFVFVNVEPVITDLIDEMIPGAELIHFVDSDVLATVVREGGISVASARRMTRLAQAAEDAGADVVFSACSSLGPALDVASRHVAVPVVKIDEAMALEAAGRARRIAVLATVPTTLKPSADLIEAKAREAGREVAVERKLCAGAFDLLMAGDRAAHDALVTREARGLVDRAEIIVLAQASMARLQSAIEEATRLPVLTSPRSGVAALARIVAGLGDAADRTAR